MESCEKETVIQFDDGEDFATVFTCHERIMNRIEKGGIQPEKFHTDKKTGREFARTYQVPIAWVKVRPPKQISAENKKLMGERLAKAKISSKHARTTGSE